MSLIADLTREFVLTSGVIIGYQTAAFRDDAQNPFKTATNKILLSVASGGATDDLTGDASITLYVMTPVNPTGAQILACATDADKVQNLFAANKGGYNGKIFGFTVISGVTGPYFDSQGRKAYGITVNAYTNTLC